jgi:hypothetical protein
VSKPEDNGELSKAAREALGRAALAAVALVVAVYVPVPMWGKIMIFFTVLFVAGLVIRIRKTRQGSSQSES